MGLFQFWRRKSRAPRQPSQTPSSSEAKNGSRWPHPRGDEADEFSLAMPGAFPSSPVSSPSLAPSDSDSDIATVQLDTMDLDYNIATPHFTTDRGSHLQFQTPMGYAPAPPVLQTELGSYLRPRMSENFYTPVRQAPATTTPYSAPPPRLPQSIEGEKYDEMFDDLLDDDPWNRQSMMYERFPFGRPVSAVQLFTPKKAQLPVNRIASIFTPEFERREKERQAQEREQRGLVRVRPFGDSVRPLSPDWMARVSKAMQASQGVPVAQSLSGDALYQKDIATCIRPLDWLNDEIINSYMTVIVQYLRQSTGNMNDRPRFHAFNSFFYSTLRDKGYPAVRRWANRAKIGGEALLDVDTVFIPVHQASHWTLLVVRPTDRTVEYFDSLGGRGPREFKVVKEWLRGELGANFDEEDWTLLPSVSSHQDNGSDCGVFLLTNAKAIALGIEPTCFQAHHTKLLRRKIVAEIMNKGLHGEFSPVDKMGHTLL